MKLSEVKLTKTISLENTSVNIECVTDSSINLYVKSSMIALVFSLPSASWSTSMSLSLYTVSKARLMSSKAMQQSQSPIKAFSVIVSGQDTIRGAVSLLNAIYRGPMKVSNQVCMHLIELMSLSSLPYI